MKLIEAVQRWWWWLFTGHDSLAAKRHAIEEDARRFGGEVRWHTDERAWPTQDDIR